MTYRNPDDLPAGGALVVGASATGVQLAEEIHRSGRPVTLCVGEHVRMPRTYRGRDIFWWTDRAGILDERHDQLDDILRARHLPSPQLIGTPERRSIDLDTLAAQGITIVGRLGRVVGGRAQLSGSLANTCTLADLKMNRLLDRLDGWAAEAGVADELGPPQRFEPTSVGASPILELDLRRAGITSALFATGYRPDHSWLDLPVFDHRGRIAHDGGAVRDAPGLYVVGHPVLRRRRSSFISGAGPDSGELAGLLHRHLDTLVAPHRSRVVRSPVL
jgi:putative flavoprotein involved in K+ transport